MRRLAVLLCFWSACAAAQFTPSAQQVLLLAPQLLAFAGSTSNFEGLASGLTAGQPITLTTAAADGSMEIATFTAADALSAADTARLLEAARQRLIAQGVAHPSSGQIAVALMGGPLVTPSGTVTLPAMIAAADPKQPFQVFARAFSGSKENYARLTEGLSRGRPITLQSAGGASVTFTPPGGPMSETEVSQTLKLASDLLAAQGIPDPTPDQLRAALVGGNITRGDGRLVLLRGVLEGRTQATSVARPGATSETPGEAQASDSAPAGRTSDTSREGHTSDSPGRRTSDRPSTGFTSDRPASK